MWPSGSAVLVGGNCALQRTDRPVAPTPLHVVAYVTDLCPADGAARHLHYVTQVFHSQQQQQVAVYTRVVGYKCHLTWRCYLLLVLFDIAITYLPSV